MTAAQTAAQSKMAQGRCVFCGGSRLTHEHVYADWTRRYIRKNVPKHGLLSTIINTPGVNPETLSNLKPVSGDPRSRRVRCVCQRCNNGWMKRIQDDVQSTAIPLITGKKTTLTRSTQKLVAMWIAMAVIVSEFSNRSSQEFSAEKTAGVPETDRRWLYNFQTIPPNWKIWIGHYPSGHDDAFWHHESLVFLDEDAPNVASSDGHRPNTQATTYTVGKLYVHAFSSVRGDVVRGWKVGTRAAHWLRQIWPSIEETIVWPPFPMSENHAWEIPGALHDFATAVNRRNAKSSPSIM
jgi:hypothetical protein